MGNVGKISHTWLHRPHGQQKCQSSNHSVSFEWNQLLHAREPSESGASIIFHLDQSHNLTIICFQFASRLPISAPNTSPMPLLSVSASSLTPTGQRGAGSPTNRRWSWTQGHGWQTGCRVRGATVLLIESSSAGPCKQQIDMQIMRVQNVKKVDPRLQQEAF